MRLLFSSIHSYLDPSSGAALATREVLEVLTARGMDCRALCAGVLDYERKTTLDEVLASLELPPARFQAELSGGGSAAVFDLTLNDVRVTLLPTSSSCAEQSPDPGEGTVFLDLAEQVLDRFQPDVLLTYGGHPAGLEVMRRARARGIAVVFHLHNFGYNDRRAFADVSTVIFPSEYSRRRYARLLGLDGPVIPYAIPRDRIVAENPANGIPVLARDRGALRETMGVAGFVFTVPARYTAHSLEIPTAREVAPWVAVIEKLWDDPEFEARHRALARAEANRWEPAVVADQFEELFRSLGEEPSRGRP